MVFIIYGTTGELIKITPLLVNLKKNNKCFTVALVQQEEQLRKFFEAYPQVPKPDLWLVNGYNNKDLDKFYQMPIWLMNALFAFIKNRKTILNSSDPIREKNIVLVHGDTMTTVAGSLIAKNLKFKLGHIESGLRSFNLMHPFPEEIDRRIVSKLARVHFAPGDVPKKNLLDAKVKGEIINTKVNTVFDSIEYADKQKPINSLSNLPKKYGVISIHRNELLVNRAVFKRTLKILAEYSKKHHMVFLQHPITLARIESLGLSSLLKDDFTYIPKLDYFSFMKLLKGADFVVTDSGGLQEECTYLNIPCLVHRKATERMDGIEEGIVQLSYYDDSKLRKFLDSPSQFKSREYARPKSPSKIIEKYLEDNSFI